MTRTLEEYLFRSVKRIDANKARDVRISLNGNPDEGLVQYRGKRYVLRTLVGRIQEGPQHTSYTKQSGPGMIYFHQGDADKADGGYVLLVGKSEKPEKVLTVDNQEVEGEFFALAFPLEANVEENKADVQQFPHPLAVWARFRTPPAGRRQNCRTVYITTAVEGVELFSALAEVTFGHVPESWRLPGSVKESPTLLEHRDIRIWLEGAS